MDGTNPVPNAQPSKVHMWILLLLSWTAVFSLLSVGLLLTKKSDSGLSTTELSAACQNGVLNGITTNLTRISEACSAEDDAPESEGTFYPGSDAWLPPFTLPENWSGYVFMNYAKEATKPYASFTGTKGVFSNCNECGGTGFPTQFWMASDTLANITRVETFVSPEFPLGSTDATTIEVAFSNNPNLTNVDVTSSSVGNGTLIEVSGTYDAGGISAYAGSFHLLQFSNATTVVELLSMDFSSGDDYKTIKDSIDWSTIK